MVNQTTKEKVRDLLDKGLTVLEVARHLNISPQATYKHLKSLGAPLPSERDKEKA